MSDSAPSRARYITPKTFAERVGCAASQVSKWRKEGKIVSVGKLIDWEHPTTKEHLHLLASSPDKRRVAYELPGDDESSDDEIDDGDHAGGGPVNFDGVEDMQHLTLAQIAERFGGLPAVGPLLKHYDVFQGARKKHIANDKAKHILVSRELVTSAIVSHYEQLHQRLLNDAANAIVRRVYAHQAAGDPIEVARETVRKEIGLHLVRAKDKVKKGLAGLSEDDGVEIFSPDDQEMG